MIASMQGKMVHKSISRRYRAIGFFRNNLKATSQFQAHPRTPYPSLVSLPVLGFLISRMCACYFLSPLKIEKVLAFYHDAKGVSRAGIGGVRVVDVVRIDDVVFVDVVG